MKKFFPELSHVVAEQHEEESPAGFNGTHDIDRDSRPREQNENVNQQHLREDGRSNDLPHAEEGIETVTSRRDLRQDEEHKVESDHDERRDKGAPGHLR